MWNCTLGGLLWLMLPFLIGLATGWWAWAQKPQLAELSPGVQPEAKPQPSAPTIAMIAPTPDKQSAAPIAKSEAPALTAIGVPSAVGPADDLQQIRGIGPKLNAILQDIGVARFDQIAAWGTADIAKIDSHLGAFKGRIVRDDWVTQAVLLAEGRIGEFEVRFGKLDSENK